MTSDPEFELLVSTAEDLKGSYIREGISDPWFGSPFLWIRTLPSRRVGKVGEQLVSTWCLTKGFDVRRSGDSDADRVIAGRRMEIKFSTLWESGVYTFQQIRDQNYEYVFCLGISPFAAHAWVIPKPIIQQHAGFQQGGQRGNDTRWLSFPATDPPPWLADYGGTLAQALEVLTRISQA